MLLFRQELPNVTAGKKKKSRNNPMVCYSYLQTALIEPCGTYWFSWKQRAGNLCDPVFPRGHLVAVGWGPGLDLPLQDVTLSIASCHPSQGSLAHMGPPSLQHPTTLNMLWEPRSDWSLVCSPELSQICPDQQRGSRARRPDLLPFTPMSQIFHRGPCEGHHFWWWSSQGPATEGHPIHQINT